MKVYFLGVILVFLIAGCTDKATTSQHNVGDINITWLGHASFEIKGSKTVYFDPFVLSNSTKKVDYILLTHEHSDHCAEDNVKQLQEYKETRIIGSYKCIIKFTGLTNSLRPGEFFEYADGVRVDYADAYNTESGYHPKNFGIGIVLTMDGIKIYHAGDTDFIPEMSKLANESIDVALLPIGGKYTMDVQGAAEAAKAIRPRIVIPMHYNSEKYGIPDVNAEPGELKRLLEGSGIEVVILKPSA